MDIEAQEAPWQAPNEAILAETLRIVNEWRAQSGREPLLGLPKGKPDNVCECPVARSVREGSNFIYASEFDVTFTTDQERYTFEYPEVVMVFVRRFDRGDYPDLLLPDPIF